MPGPAPKKPGMTQRGKKHSTAATLETVEPPVTDHPLPDGDWHAEAVAFWDELWSSPMAPEYVRLDVRRFRMLLRVVDDFWRADKLSDRLKAAAEIRMQGQLFGLSPLDRRRLQWEVRRVEAASKPDPAPSRPRDPRLRAVS